MPTKKPIARPIDLCLAVQYAVAAPELPRWRLRRWVARSLDTAAQSLPQLRAGAFTLRLVDLDEGQSLNRQYRERDYATNVLTFEYGIDPDGLASADIVLCLPVLLREAHEQGKTCLNHAAHLVVHGILHSLGHDHQTAGDAQRMEALEVLILNSLGITNPYL